MSTHFKWYPAESEVVVPFNARYSFPSQANKAIKMTPRIPPKNSGTFAPGNVIRLEFPAQGYINPGKTTLEFDVTMLYTPYDAEFSILRFQNNIQSIFNRVRLLYGATPIEDIPYYNVIVRQLTEWTGTNQMAAADQFSVTDGIGGIAAGNSGQQNTASSTALGASNGARQPLPYINIRQKHIHGIDMNCQGGLNNPVFPAAANPQVVISANVDGVITSTPSGHGVVPNQSVSGAPLIPATGIVINPIHNTVFGGNPTRRYQVQLALGIFNQEKLIPTKFMASQLAIEITLENPQACMYYQPSSTFLGSGSISPAASVNPVTGLGTPSATPPSYQVTNVNLIPEILEFDASYDESFLKGLQTGGVPIKFATWNNYRFSNNGVSSINLQIQERSRSVKAIFCMQRRAPETFGSDSGAAFFNTAVGSTSNVNGASTFQEYQYRIGGR
jgi:hypothetical protein